MDYGSFDLAVALPAVLVGFGGKTKLAVKVGSWRVVLRCGDRRVTNPNPKVRKSGAVAKAVRASLFFARWFLKLEG